MKPKQDLLAALQVGSLALLTLHLDLTDPDIENFKDVDMTDTIRVLRVCIKKMKDFEIMK